MTLIAFATYGKKRAEFITDTAAWSHAADWTGRCTKHLILNHLDAAVLNNGSMDFGHMLRAVLLEASPTMADFDDLVDQAPSLFGELRQFWRENSPSGGRTGVNYQSTVALIGWSDRAQEFVGYVLASAHDFEPTIPEGLWAWPMPKTSRPSDLELGSLPDSPELAAEREQWRARPPRPTPTRTEDWRSLAVDVRRQRTSGWAGIGIAGDVIHTRLERGSAISRRIHTYDDGGEEFGRMVEGTAHPVALARACYCGSGVPFGECHISNLLEKPCYCESGKTFGTCCWRSPALAVLSHR